MSADQFSALKGSVTEFESGLPLLPFGEFTTFAPYAKHSKQPANVRKLPVLRAKFDTALFDPRCPDFYFGYGAIPLGDVVALTFRVQFGADFLYWLANPADAEVWKVMDQWAAARRMVLAVEFGDEALLAVRDFRIHPQLETMRLALKQTDRMTPEFVRDVSNAMLTDELLKVVRTDIKKYPKIRGVQTRMVKTTITGGVAVMVSDAVPRPGESEVEMAARELAQQIYRPAEPRH